VTGETLNVSATVTNVGGTQGTSNQQTIELRVNGTTEDTTSIQLGAGTQQTVDLSATLDDPGTANVEVASDDDTDPSTVDVLTQASFDVTSVDATNTVTVGETLDVTASVDNTGEAEASDTIELRVDGNVVDSASTGSLAGGSSTDVSLSYSASADDVGSDVLVEAKSSDGVASTTADIEEQSTEEDDDDAGGGGGGGGGGALFPEEGPQPVVTTSAPILDETPQTQGTTVEFDNADAVQRVTFDSEGIASGSVEVSEFAGAPGEIADEVSSQVAADAGTAVDTAGAVDVVKAVEISPTSDSAASSSATVELEVDSDELDSPADAVVVHEVSDGSWETLETSAQSSGGTVTLTAEVESFSQFAVAELSPAQVETPTPVSTPESVETPTPSGPAEATPEQTPEPAEQEEIDEGTPEPEPEVADDTETPAQEPAGFNLTAGLAVLLLAGILVVVFFLRRRDAI